MIGLLDIIVLGIALSMDSFAISLAIGLSIKYYTKKHKFYYLLSVSLMHIAMILIGWLGGGIISQHIGSYGHIISSILLALLGLNMIRESFKQDQQKKPISLSLKGIIAISLTVSLDALSSGISLSMTKVQIGALSAIPTTIIASIIIGLIIFIISYLGLFSGTLTKKLLGKFANKAANILGGIILLLLATKIILESS